MPHRGIEPALAACRFDVLPTKLHPRPGHIKTREHLETKFLTGSFYLDLFFPVEKASSVKSVPAGSSSRGGDVAVYAFDMNQQSLPTPFFFILLLCQFLFLWRFQLYFIS